MSYKYKILLSTDCNMVEKVFQTSKFFNSGIVKTMQVLGQSKLSELNCATELEQYVQKVKKAYSKCYPNKKFNIKIYENTNNVDISTDMLYSHLNLESSFNIILYEYEYDIDYICTILLCGCIIDDGKNTTLLH